MADVFKGLQYHPVVKEIIAETNRVVAESMTDPDLASKSADYRAGYERGFKEAVYAAVAHKLKAKP